MAKREISKEATGATAGWRISCFVLAYLYLITNEPSDEAKEEAPPSLPSSPRRDPESLTLTPPDSSFNSSLDNILITLPYTSTPSAVPPPPPPPPPQNDNSNLHPVIGVMRDQELGKATLSFAIPIALAILTSGEKKLAQWEMSFILIALSVGCTAIWNGILLRNTYPKTAQVLEPLGIAVVVISFNGLIAFLLPVELFWVPAVCIGLSLLPFIIAACQRYQVG